jgi:hypothetical protein
LDRRIFTLKLIGEFERKLGSIGLGFSPFSERRK